jgi:hypothetical protein
LRQRAARTGHKLDALNRVHMQGIDQPFARDAEAIADECLKAREVGRRERD